MANSVQTAAGARSRPVILDGALGTELERRGFETTLPLWSAKALIEAPSLVWEIHRDYVEAGAEVLSACTFRTTPYTLRKVGLEKRAEELTHQAVRYARAAAIEHSPPPDSSPSQKAHSKQSTGAEILQPGDGLQDDKRGVMVAGSVAPLEDCYRPENAPFDEILRNEHARFAKMLAEADVDLILVETQNTQREAVIATQAAAATGLPVWTSLMPKSATELFNGDDLAETAWRVHESGAQVVLINCARPAIAAGAFGVLAVALKGEKVGLYPNLLDQNVPPEGFANWMKEFAPHAAVLGGCCGTTPEHIRALSRQIQTITEG